MLPSQFKRISFYSEIRLIIFPNEENPEALLKKSLHVHATRGRRTGGGV
jgi:hypothetical protein